MFKTRYAPFFTRAKSESKKQSFAKLASKIEERNVQLHEMYPDEEEAVNFGDQVLGEVKKFVVLALLTAIKFYEPSVSQMLGSVRLNKVTM